MLLALAYQHRQWTNNDWKHVTWYGESVYNSIGRMEEFLCDGETVNPSILSVNVEVYRLVGICTGFV